MSIVPMEPESGIYHVTTCNEIDEISGVRIV